MENKKLFRVYFYDHTCEIWGGNIGFQFRHIIADDKQDAENIVKAMIEDNKEFLDSKKFDFKYISEEIIHPFSDYINGEKLNYSAIFEKMKEEAIAEEDMKIFEMINIISESINDKQEGT